MIQNKLFRDCLAAIPAEQKAEFDLSFGIAERISEILKAKGLTQKDFARLLNKRDSEISKWLTGRHNFTTQTIARIETALGSKLISIAHWLGYAYKQIFGQLQTGRASSKALPILKYIIKILNLILLCFPNIGN